MVRDITAVGKSIHSGLVLALVYGYHIVKYVGKNFTKSKGFYEKLGEIYNNGYGI